jgi:hypothetical protein
LAWPRTARTGKPGTPRPGQGVGLSTRTETPGPSRPGKVVGPWTPPSPTRRPRRRPITLPTGAAERIEGPWKERTRKTGPPRPRKQRSRCLGAGQGGLICPEEAQPRDPPGRWDTQPPGADGVAWLGGVVWACH